MLPENQCLHHTRRPNPLYYFDAGLVAGTAAFSSLAGTLFAGFASFLTSSVFLTSVLAGAGAVTAGAAGLTSTLAGSAAKTDAADNATRVAIILFILISFKVSFELVPVCNNYS